WRSCRGSPADAVHPLVVLATAGLAVVGFVVGAVNPATIVARALGRDLRTSGSGNPGATNAGRVLGRRWGALVLALDVLKAYLPTVVVLRTVGVVPALATGFAVVVGHVYSPFLRGRGGKGAACALGAVTAVQPWLGLVVVMLFLLANAALPFVGEASAVTAAVVLVVGAAGTAGAVPGVSWAVGGWLVLVCLLVLSRHRRNVRAWWARRARTSGGE
ncbi:MAG: glycerol-3-phosphate acyltransferase, partial [Phycicoccus sp.]